MCSTPRISCLRMEVEIERDDALADVLGVIADPLKIVADAHSADDLAQIDRHRLPPRDGQDRLFLDVVLHRVDGGIGRDDALGKIGIALQSAPGRHRRSGAPASPPISATLPRDLLQVGVECLGGVVHPDGDVGHVGHPKRPVM